MQIVSNFLLLGLKIVIAALQNMKLYMEFSYAHLNFMNLC
jgi:hypothetical protein